MRMKMSRYGRFGGGLAQQATASGAGELQADCPISYRLRPFRDGDCDAVHRLIHGTIDACYTGLYPPRAVAFFKQHHSQSNILERAQQGYTIVVESDGRIVGTGTVVGGHIHGVFIAAELQHHGLGHAIMQYLEAVARTCGATTMTLDVSLPSRRFYERLGYRMLENASLDVGKGQRLDYWKAAKSLLPAVDDSIGRSKVRTARVAVRAEAHPTEDE